MKRLPYILVILLAIPFIANAALPGDATLTLNTRVNAIFLHGFFGPSIVLDNASSLPPNDIFGQFFPGDPEQYAGLDIPEAFTDGRNLQLSQEDFIDDFDFGEDDYDIGYYLFVTNVVGAYTVSFTINPFHESNIEYTIPWTLQIDYAGGNISFGDSKELRSGGTIGFNDGTGTIAQDIFNTGTAATNKYIALKLTMLSKFDNQPIKDILLPASENYIATVVASVTSP